VSEPVSTEPASVSQTLLAAPDLAFSAFVTPFLLKQWLCNDCKIDQRMNGKFFLTWNDSSHVVGRFTAWEPGEQVAFTWHGSDDASDTRDTVRMAPEGDQIRQTLASVAPAAA
jgi:uncharacterized protein YndB with AHSA1/START domain